MNATATVENNIATLAGRLDHSTVPAMLKTLSNGESYSEINLRNIEHSNSAGIAMLLQLIEQHDGALTISAIPEQMQRVADLSGVEELLNR